MSEVFNQSVLDAINRAVQDGVSTTALEVDGTPQYCIINAETREIEIPGELNIFGVESDEKSTRVYFRCPKYVGTNVDLDMTQCMVYVPYRNANREKDQYIVTDLNETEDGENVEFTWLISRKASAYMGITEFGIRAIKTVTGGTIEAEWNTTVASANVIRGMDVGLLEFSEENKDAIAQAVDLVKQEIEQTKQTSLEEIDLVKQEIEQTKQTSLEEIEQKGEETLATIPEEYTQLQTDVDGLYEEINNKFEDIPYDNWDKLPFGSDGISNWCNTHEYRAGFVKNIIFKSIGSDKNGNFYIFRKRHDEYYSLYRTYSVITVNGLNTIEVNDFIPCDFIISHMCEGVAYTVDETWNDSAVLNEHTGKLGKGQNYPFGVKIAYAGIKTSLFLLNKEINMASIKFANILNGVNYPIIFNFEENKITITDTWLFFTGNENITTNAWASKHINDIDMNIDHNVYDENGDFVDIAIILAFNIETDTVVKLEFNNSTNPFQNFNYFKNNYVFAFVWAASKNSVLIFDINSNHIKVIAKDIVQEKLTANDYKTKLPRYAERYITTTDIVNNKYFGKKCNIIGDSIFAGEDPDNEYIPAENDNLSAVIREEFGFSVVRNYGYGGCSISNNNSNSVYSRYPLMSEDADLIIIQGGTNDWHGNTKIGNLSDLSDKTKFIPALYSVLNGIMTKYPESHVLVVTPTQRTDTSSLTNSNGDTLKDFRDAMILVCEELSVPYVDMWVELGITPKNDAMKKKYIPDGLHFNSLGYRKYYSVPIVNKIRQLI